MLLGDLRDESSVDELDNARAVVVQRIVVMDVSNELRSLRNEISERFRAILFSLNMASEMDWSEYCTSVWETSAHLAYLCAAA